MSGCIGRRPYDDFPVDDEDSIDQEESEASVMEIDDFAK